MTNASVTEARQLRAQGVPITLLDGREVRLIFDVEAIAEIEDNFGSLEGMQDKLNEIMKHGVKAQFFKPLLQMMRAALLHDPSASDAKFDSAVVGDYFNAVMKAVELHFPKDETPRKEPTQVEHLGRVTVPQTSSLTPTSTTSSPSSSEEPTPSSGD